MRRTALLIGAQTYGLTGVEHDVDTMAGLLESRGFKAVRGIGAQASRAAILDSFERLIRDTRYGDAVVFYFSGHGGLAVSSVPADFGRAVPRLQFLVPTDFEDSTASDFRGITDPELSVLLARLTWATPNVTVILDACHAAHAMRDGMLPKALYQHPYVDLAAHLDRLRGDGLDPSIRHVLGNPDAVRLVACRRDQSAYEYTNKAGRRIGLFTEALAIELRQAGPQPVTWATLIEQVRHRIQPSNPYQRPEAEGPSLRLPFQTNVSYPSDRPATFRPDGRALGADVGIEWGRVVAGRPCPLPFTGAQVHAGEHVYVRVRNRSAATVYVSLLLVQEFARVSLLTSMDPSGIALAPGEEHTVGSDELDDRLVGVELLWPSGVDRGDPLLRTITVVVGSGPADMAQEQRRGPVYRDAGQQQSGRVYRDLAPLKDDGVLRRDVHPITFRLIPHPS